MKVSVVIPTHNAGRDADRNIRMLLAQTLPRDEFEVIWVNDGSTDNTAAMLDQLAAEHPHFRVIHIPASGWPGRPRNVGIDAAKGEYIQFLDHDDHLAKDALRYQYEFAKRNDSDIVLGKQVSFRHPPSPVFRETRAKVDITTFPLWNSLKPHKFIRREFLIEHDLRFDDEPRRLEDGHFMMRAYFAARTVSIAADYTCYFHTKREDGKNIAGSGIEPHGYFSDVEDIIDIVEQRTDPGEFRNRILHRFYRSEMLGRLRDDRISRYSPEFLAQLVDALHPLAKKRFPAAVREAFPPVQRRLSELMYAGDLAGLKAFSAYTENLKGRSRLRALRVTKNKLLRLRWSAELRTPDRRPVRFVGDEHGVAIDPELLGGTRLARGRSVNARVFVINHATGEKVALDGSPELVIEQLPATDSKSTHTEKSQESPENNDEKYVRVQLKGLSTLDPRKLAVGAWHLEIHFWLVGLRRTTHVKAVPDRDTLEALAFHVGNRPRPVTPSVTDQGRFVLLIGKPREIQDNPTGHRLIRRAARTLPRGLRRRLRRMVRRSRG